MKTEDEVMDRQDFVDGEIYRLLESLAGKELKWDIEVIGYIRDILEGYFERSQIMMPEDFYPGFSESYNMEESEEE